MQQDTACDHHSRLKIEKLQAQVVNSSRELNFSVMTVVRPTSLRLVASG